MASRRPTFSPNALAMAIFAPNKSASAPVPATAEPSARPPFSEQAARQFAAPRAPLPTTPQSSASASASAASQSPMPSSSAASATTATHSPTLASKNASPGSARLFPLSQIDPSPIRPSQSIQLSTPSLLSQVHASKRQAPSPASASKTHAAAPALHSPSTARRGETDAADFFSDAAEFDPTAAPLSLRTLGLPTSCVDAYAKAGIRQLWQWQFDALSLPGVLTGAKNLVYSTPTSSGKSLVAEIVSILSVKRSGKLALFVVPFVAIAEEKLAFFRKVLKGSGIRCEGYYGDVGPTRDSRLVLPRRDEHGRNCIAVCILEKADRLLLQLGAEDCLHELCVVVVDELHHIGDRLRGDKYEVLLSKLSYLQEKSFLSTASPFQLVAMSATISQTERLTSWLHADMFNCDHRPIQLTHLLKDRCGIYNQEFKLVETLPSASNHSLDDSLHVAELIIRSASQGKSVLVFCADKQSCQNLCEFVAQRVRQSLPHQDGNEDLMEKRALLEKTIRSSCEQASVDESCNVAALRHGISFHHGSVTSSVRQLLEQAFRAGILSALCCTSTLSTGVNLPASIVIIRHTRVGNEAISPQLYKQMAGRAGRSGLADSGVVYLFATREVALRLWASLAPAQEFPSLLVPGDVLRTLVAPKPAISVAAVTPVAMLLLQCIRSGIVMTESDARLLVARTWFAQQSPAADRFAALAILLLSGNLAYSALPAQAVASADATLERWRSPAGASSALAVQQDGAFVLATPSGRLECTLFGTACAESDLKIDQVLDLVARLRVLSAKGLCTDSKFQAIEFLCHFGFSSLVKFGLRDDSKAALFAAISRWCSETGNESMAEYLPLHGDPSQIHLLRYQHAIEHIIIDRSSIGHSIGATKQYLCVDFDSMAIQNLLLDATLSAAKTLKFLQAMKWQTLFVMLNAAVGNALLTGGCLAEARPLLAIATNGLYANALHAAGHKTVAAVAALSSESVRRTIMLATNFVPTSDGNYESHEAHLTDVCECICRNAAAAVSGSKNRLKRPAGNVLHAPAVEANSDKRNALSHESLFGAIVRANSDLKHLQEANEFREASVADISAALKSASSSATFSALVLAPTNSFRVPSSVAASAAPKKSVPAFTSLARSSFGASVVRTLNVHVASSARIAEFFRQLKAQPKFALSLSSRSIADADLLGRDSIFREDEEIEKRIRGLTVDDISIIAVAYNHDFFALRFPSPELNLAAEQHEFVAHVWNQIREVLSSDSCKMIFQAKGVLQIMRLLGIRVRGLLLDPVVLLYTIDPDKFKVARDEAVQLDALVQECAANFDHGQVRPPVSSSRNSAADVCMGRARKTWYAAHCLETAILKMPTLLHRLMLDECKLIPILARMEWHGVPIQKSYFRKHRLELEHRLKYLELLAANLVGRQVNLCSPHDCAVVLWDELGLENTAGAESSKSGRSVGKEVLAKLCQMPQVHPFVLLLQEHRDLSFLLHSWVAKLSSDKSVANCTSENEPGAFVGDSSGALSHCRIHATFSQTGAATGRLSCYSPNLQAVPKAAFEFAPAVRKSLHQEMNDSSVESVQALIAAAQLPDATDADRIQLVVYVALASGNCKMAELAEISERNCAEAFDDAHAVTLAAYWRGRGVAFDDEEAARTRQVRVRFASMTGAPHMTLSFPSHRVWRLAAFFVDASGVDQAVVNEAESQALLYKPVRLNCRDAFVAPEGYELLCIDYSQIELRLMAHFSDDHKMKAILVRGGDIIRSLAGEWLGIDDASVTDLQRTNAKKLIYSLLYGRGNRSLSEELGVGEREVVAFKKDFFAKFPQLKVYLDAATSSASVSATATTISGRQRCLPNVNSADAGARSQARRQLINFGVQGSAAELCKQAMLNVDGVLSQIELDLGRERAACIGARDAAADDSMDGTDQFAESSLDAATSSLDESVTSGSSSSQAPPDSILNLLPAARLILQVHDELLFEVRTDLMDRVLPLICAAMLDISFDGVRLSVPLQLQVSAGKSWGSLVKIKQASQ